MNLIMIHELEVPLNHGIFILDDVKGCIRGVETMLWRGIFLGEVDCLIEPPTSFAVSSSAKQGRSLGVKSEFKNGRGIVGSSRWVGMSGEPFLCHLGPKDYKQFIKQL